MSELQKCICTCLLAGSALLVGSPLAFAGNASPLGAASNFAVLSAASGGKAVTCSDSTIIGNLGSAGVADSVDQTNCSTTGAVVAPVSADVWTDFGRAYDMFSNSSCTGSLNVDYTNTAQTMSPGVYCYGGSVTFTGATITLDAQGDPNAVWIFKIGADTAGALAGTNFSVVMANGGQSRNVFWWSAKAVTMTTSGFQGNILAGAAVTVTGVAGSATPFDGSVLAKAAVKLTNVTVTGRDSSAGGAKSKSTCNQGVGNGPESCDPASSDVHWLFGSNDELGGLPGSPGRKGGISK